MVEALLSQPVEASAGGGSLIPLPRVAGELRTAYGRVAPAYHAIWCAASAGRIRVVRLGGRLYVAQAELSAVAEVFGLTPLEPRAAA